MSLEDRRYSLYVLTFPDDKIYVGITSQDPVKRWRYGSGYKNQKRLYSAIEKFGWDNVKHEVIKDDLDVEEAKRLEIEYIKKYDSSNKACGYNTKSGGQTFGEHSEWFIESMKKRMMGNKYCVGRKLRQSHIDALVRANKGSKKPCKFKGMHIRTEEQKKHLSDLAKERWSSEEYRKKCELSRRDMAGENNPMFGKKHSDETKRKIAEKATGRVVTDEARRKMSAANKNKKRVLQYTNEMIFVREYESIAEAAENVGAKKENIGFCCRNHHRTSKGYYWRYANENRS